MTQKENLDRDIHRARQPRGDRCQQKGKDDTKGHRRKKRKEERAAKGW